ncbi:MAG TPA: hypothetical protein VNZ25_07770 [Candidatus Angelobacter sp.]|jgi:hypothetical protein|nr:hypothetical protein [Candidatus Angelobacter sp.]
MSQPPTQVESLKPMQKQTIISTAAFPLMLLCCALGTWATSPSMITLNGVIGLGCFVYLIYYSEWLKRYLTGEPSPEQRYWKKYSKPIWLFGWVFILAGTSGVLFTFDRIFFSGPQIDEVPDWKLLAMWFLTIAVGMVLERIGKIRK